MNIAHPTLQARDIATLIDNDPIMASQIKEFIRHDRLLELLSLDYNDQELVDLVVKRDLGSSVIQHMEDKDILAEVSTRMN